MVTFDLIGRVDTQLFRVINTGCAHPVLDRIMPYITLAGDGQVVFYAALLVLLILRKRAFRTAVIIFAGLTVTYYLTSVSKDFFARPRPFSALTVRQLAHASGFSFPSGHAATAFMTAAILDGTAAYGRVYFVLACLVALSRIYLGVHYPGDVIAGAILGIGIGYLLVRMSRAGSVGQRVGSSQ